MRACREERVRQSYIVIKRAHFQDNKKIVFITNLVSRFKQDFTHRISVDNVTFIHEVLYYVNF